MCKIAVIYMGGTFGCIGSPLSPMPALEFIDKLKLLNTHHPELSFFSAPIIKDSTELMTEDWLNLAQLITTLSENFKKFIILHGTDTLNYASAFLHHLFGQKLQIILTGSQYPLLTIDGMQVLENSDARANFSFAYAQALLDHQGVFLAFNQRLHQGYCTYKQHTEDYDAFLSFTNKDHRPIPIATNLVISTQHLKNATSLNILNYYFYPASAEQHLQNLSIYRNNLPHIIILQAFGSGNIPYSPALAELLQQYIEQGCWIIVSSQVLSGALSQKYQTGSWLNNINLVIDPHYSQADLYARSVLLYLQYGHEKSWQQYWL